ncbi:unnamed protein product [Boreogadus saida]
MELSYQSMRTAHQVREAEELKTETRKKDLLILIYHHLMDHGYMDSAGVLDGQCNGGLQRLEVCDNVDLETVLMEYQTYHYIKFNKYPRLTRRAPPTVETRQVSSCGKKRNPSVKPLPKISPTHRPYSGGGARNSEPHVAIRNRSENGLVDPTLEFGLNVSSFAHNGASGEGSSRKLKDNKAVIQDASRRGHADTDHAERLLKPLGAFITTSSEMKELAAIISKLRVEVSLSKTPNLICYRWSCMVDPLLVCECVYKWLTSMFTTPNVHWDDIMGLVGRQAIRKRGCCYPIKYPQLFTGILSPWKGLLLYGPPGTGKTLWLRRWPQMCSTTFLQHLSPPPSSASGAGDSEKLIRVLFELAKFHAPSTIFLDELESVMGQRGGGHGGEHEGSRRMKTELLIQMDGLAASDHLVFILAASNMPW